MVVRRFVHSQGFRYRLHVSGLPGKPDLVFPSRKRIIFVHGCFWHLHEGCREGRIPASRVAYWEPKLLANGERDRRNIGKLRRQGWRVLVVWECEVKNAARLERRLLRFLQ